MFLTFKRGLGSSVLVFSALIFTGHTYASSVLFAR